MRSTDKAFIVKISGRVTGVGFRYHVMDAASKLPALTGYVRNVGYGEVEALVQGDSESLDAILAVLRKGPSFARVDSCLINEVPVNPELKGFSIR